MVGSPVSQLEPGSEILQSVPGHLPTSIETCLRACQSVANVIVLVFCAFPPKRALPHTSHFAFCSSSGRWVLTPFFRSTLAHSWSLGSLLVPFDPLPATCTPSLLFSLLSARTALFAFPPLSDFPLPLLKAKKKPPLPYSFTLHLLSFFQHFLGYHGGIRTLPDFRHDLRDHQPVRMD